MTSTAHLNRRLRSLEGQQPSGERYTEICHVIVRRDESGELVEVNRITKPILHQTC